MPAAAAKVHNNTKDKNKDNIANTQNNNTNININTMGTSSSSSSRGRASSSTTAKIAQLRGMGFQESAARAALESTQGNVDAAVELLIQQGPAATAGSAGSDQRSTHDQHAREQRAQAAENRLRNDALSSMRTGSGGARSSKAAKSTAAAAAASRTGDAGGVELLLKSTAECLAASPKAVDTLGYALDTIIKNPKVQKYRELKMTNKAFAASIGSAGPAAIHFLAAVGFEASGEWQVLKHEDTVRLWLGKSALEAVQQSPQYLVAKDDLLFQKAMAASKKIASEEETIRREKFQRLVPPAPTPGAAGTTVIRVFVGASSFIERNFASDESLMKIVWWLGAEQSSVMPDKLKENVWELVDVTLNPSRIVDVNMEAEKTLHAMGFWPSAELRVQAAGTEKRKMAMLG